MKNRIKMLIIALSMVIGAQSNANLSDLISKNKENISLGIGAGVALYAGHKAYKWLTTPTLKLNVIKKQDGSFIIHHAPLENANNVIIGVKKIDNEYSISSTVDLKNHPFIENGKRSSQHNDLSLDELKDKINVHLSKSIITNSAHRNALKKAVLAEAIKM